MTAMKMTSLSAHFDFIYYAYDCFEKCLDAKVCEYARIHDMRQKIPEDNRFFGKVYLENTQMAARFQFTQIDEAELRARLVATPPAGCKQCQLTQPRCCVEAAPTNI
jgi:hypothetical protein